MSHESAMRITETVMGPSRRAMPSFQASAAKSPYNRCVHTNVGYCVMPENMTEKILNLCD